eukprot:3740595-Prymnesium_polylepis.1
MDNCHGHFSRCVHDEPPSSPHLPPLRRALHRCVVADADYTPAQGHTHPPAPVLAVLLQSHTPPDC